MDLTIKEFERMINGQHDNRHAWDRSGERCLKCGQKSWMVGSYCDNSKLQKDLQEERAMDKLEEAFEVCQLWFNHLERQRQRSETLQKAASLARQGKTVEAQRLKSQVDSDPHVYDGATLLPAVKLLIEAARKYQHYEREIMPELERLAEARKKATGGEWELGLCSQGEECWCRVINIAGTDDCVIPSGSVGRDDAAFIAESANIATSLMKKLERD